MDFPPSTNRPPTTITNGREIKADANAQGKIQAVDANRRVEWIKNFDVAKQNVVAKVNVFMRTKKNRAVVERHFVFFILLSFLAAGCVTNQPETTSSNETIPIAETNSRWILFSAYPAETIKISDIVWNGPFGYRREEPNNQYLPVTQGLFLTPQSTNFVDMIHSWLGEHTNAEAVVIYTLSPIDVNNPNSKMKSVWITDGENCLNVFLVRNGSCPAFTMLLNPGDKTPLTQEQYESTAKKILEAETLARQEEAWYLEQNTNNKTRHFSRFKKFRQRFENAAKSGLRASNPIFPVVPV